MDINRLGASPLELELQPIIDIFKALPHQQVTAALPLLEAIRHTSAANGRIAAIARLINEGVIRSDQ